MGFIVVFNEKSANGNGESYAKKIEEVLNSEEISYVSAQTISDYDEFISSNSKTDRIILCGGDGTLNYYVNHTTEETRKIDIDYFAAGTGNDFLRDIETNPGEIVENVNRILQNLPTVTIEGKSYKFFNGVGFGIDGYCCEVGDRQKLVSNKPVNYTGIAIKGILFNFKPVTATIIIDGKTVIAEKTWLVPTMKGRFYGGGMMPTPAQDRNDPERKVSVMTYKTGFGLKALIVFPKIFKGEHINSKIVNIYSGNEIRVKFDRPCAAQIDGETVTNVTEYVVTTK